MHFITIDTCDWIGIAKKNRNFLDILKTLVDENKIKIIIPSVIIDEWNRNKQSEVIDSLQKELINYIKIYRHISNMLNETPKDTNELLSICNQNSIEFIKTLDNFFNSPYVNIIDSESDILIIKSFNMMLDKKAPAHKKNSTGDMLIIQTCIDYVNKNELTPYFFISNNYTDFADENKEIHPDIKKEFFPKIEFSYYHNIGKAINELKTNAIPEEIVNAIEVEIPNSQCPICKSKSMILQIVVDEDSSKESTWEVCTNCGAKYPIAVKYGI